MKTILGLKLESVTANKLARAGFTELDELAAATPEMVAITLELDSCEQREVARAMLDRHKKPVWLKRLAAHFDYSGMEMSAGPASEAGLRSITTPFERHQHWMMELALADLRRGNIPHAVVKSSLGFYEVWRKGAITTEGED